MKIILLALLYPLAVSAQITNGDFESHPIGTGTSQNVAAGQDPNNFLPGWYVVFGNVELKNISGNQLADLNGLDTRGNGLDTGGIQQTVSDTTDKYTLSFDWTPNTTEANFFVNAVAAVVNWNSQTLAALNYPVNNGPVNQPFHVSLTVQGHASDTLQFISRNTGPGGVMIDNVTLNLAGPGDPLSPPVADPGLNPAPVPEPRQDAAFAGLALCAFAVWRKSF